MPGIVGIASLNGSEARKQMLEEMIASVNHRPASYTVSRHFTAICDIARVGLGRFNPSQPVFSKDRSLCGFMDGKIYEYGLEKAKLFALQNQASTSNDIAICLELYKEKGLNFIDGLNGSFSLFIVDLKEKKVLILNDRYGLRPVYYAKSSDAFFFASEAKAIWRVLPTRQINNEAIVEWCTFGELLGDKTLFDGVRVLSPGSILTYTCEDRKISIDTYWDFEYAPDYRKSDEEFVSQLVKTFKKAVNIRMEESHRYGISLSGGLDSRAVVAAVGEDKWSKTTLFTFGPPYSHETTIARRVAAKVGQKIRTVNITPKMILKHACDEVYLSDGMDYIGVSYIVPVHEAIRPLVDVVLDGFELDLTLGGSYLSEELLTADEKELPHLLYQRLRKLSEFEMKKLFRKKFHDMIAECPYRSFSQSFEEAGQAHPGNHCDCFFLKNHLRRNTLMGHVLLRTVVENTVPTCDYRFLEVIAKIPPEKRMHHYIYRKFLMALSPTLARLPYNKTMLPPSAPLQFWRLGERLQYYKEAIKRELACSFPGKLSLRNKRSYVDFDGWLRTEHSWKSYFRDLLLGENSRSTVYFNPEYVTELIETHGTTRARFGRRNNAMIILYLATVEWFLRLFGE